MVTRSEIIDAFGYFARVRLQNGPAPEEMGATVDAWEVTLDDISGQELQVAALKWAKSSKWWPTPSEIRELIPQLQGRKLALEAADAVTGRDRWPAVVAAAGSLGRNCSDWPEKLAARIGVQDSERLKRAIDDCGGWMNLCNANHDAQRASMGKRFAASWDRQARAGLLQGAPQRALEGSRGDVAAPIDLAAEVARRKALGGSHGPR